MKTILTVEVKLELTHRRRLNKKEIRYAMNHIGTGYYSDNNVSDQKLEKNLIQIEECRPLKRRKEW